MKSSYLKRIYLLLKEYLKKEFVNKKIAQFRQGEKLLHISIFENGQLYEMKGENLYDEGEILTILYGLAKEGKLKIFEE